MSYVFLFPLYEDQFIYAMTIGGVVHIECQIWT